MKSHLKKLSLTLAILLIFSMCLGVMAMSGERVYQKYNYQEKFEYNDEMIGHALKSVVPKIFLEYKAEVSYRPVEFDSDKLSDDFEDLCREYRGEYTEDEIAAFLIQYMSDNIHEYLAYGRPRTTDVGGVGTGSGVVISEDGYIATNAHVASLDEQGKMNMYIYGLSEQIIENLETLVKDIESYGVEMTEADIMELQEILIEAASEDAEVRGEETILKVCFPGEDGDTTYDENTEYYLADVVKIGTQEDKEGLTQDMAILKIDAENLVALPLSDSYPESNSQIVSAGYPAVADEIFAEYGSDASTLSVSIVTGKVARTIDIDGSDYKAIEISSTISNGSSGGPSVDNNLNIEGLNTYMSNRDNRFAYMVPAEFVADMAEEFDISRGAVTKTFLTGLQMLQQGYGKSAEKCFEYVKDMQPNTPYIKNLISLAKDAPQKEYGEKGSSLGFFDKLYEFYDENQLLILFSAAGVITLIIILVIFLIIRKKRKKKRAYLTENTETSADDEFETYYPEAEYEQTIENDSYSEQQAIIYPEQEAPVYENYEITDNANIYAESSSYENYEVIPETTDPMKTLVYGHEEKPAESAREVYVEKAYSAEPPPPRLRSTMKKTAPEDDSVSADRDMFFNTPTDL